VCGFLVPAALTAPVAPLRLVLYLGSRAARSRQLVDRSLAPGALTHRDLRWSRIVRTGVGVLAVAGAVFGISRALQTPTGSFATASG
jgi:hypothetical protein